MLARAFTLRRATEGDRELLFALKRTSFRDHVIATWGAWDEAAQRAHFDARFDPGPQEIVVVEGRDAGTLAVRWDEDPVVLASIELAPEVRGQGIGTALVRGVLDRAGRAGRAVWLRVLKVNRARALYERLGFRVTKETETHFEMMALP